MTQNHGDGGSGTQFSSCLSGVISSRRELHANQLAWRVESRPVNDKQTPPHL